MASNHHDTGYKELFSHPEFVQQLIEGFAPNEIASLMNFSTLKQHSGNYITPLFEEKFEDVVWSVDVTWNGVTQDVVLYILLEFQSKIDNTMPLRLMHYVACFYDHLLKNRSTTARQGLPPIFPVVLYNGSQRWSAQQDIYDMVQPEPPEFLRAYQPHLRYYLIDEGHYTDEELSNHHSPLSGVFGIENAGHSWEALQQAVDRVVGIIEADPNKERVDRIITRWIKRHLSRLGAGLHLERLDSLTEDRDMLAENLENLVKKERLEGLQEGLQEGRQEGLQEGLQEGALKARCETARNLLSFGVLSDQQISDATGLKLEEIAKLRLEDKH
ncbi:MULTISPECIES: Rpn family recombination-promoting nuclease/putative transposase [unclassified Marinobacter]|jgi:predicted transposase/invertase (TIGR01784 family)|uniref:Rpn family recombination-promoting nuclease/putative transposase n=1 Tax=unclassified Marinobacter TaxID=83889 RepID=UPI00200FA50D|nr:MULTISPECIES: Rpn family recombination-promoting nuclease/putative transposase [unclassified Marinobacter]UQG54432.1 Rpn family recombination-promoting nuclease/putative transposase [Marinobacter sp. M4C]UQG63239.1 Rpn family recombination-promoting nuclease/putative transposase [Marinobacter sp. M2C]UQG67517.1 Rpn family recombination-promoting nuclease/putative transposase [Marinobacter sp. M1C]